MTEDRKDPSTQREDRSELRYVREDLLAEGAVIEGRGDRSERELRALAGELSALDRDIASARALAARDPLTARARREPPPAAVHGEHVTLRDGAEIVIRPIEPGDALQLEAGLEHLSAISRYRRFRAPVERYSSAELDWLTHVDHVRHEALVALDPRDGTLVGVVRYLCLADDQTRAHVTYVVADSWQGRGVGAALIERLARHARAVGVEHWTARMLVGDAAARGVLARVADELDQRRDAGVVEVTAHLRSQA